VFIFGVPSIVTPPAGPFFPAPRNSSIASQIECSHDGRNIRPSPINRIVPWVCGTFIFLVKQ
jgi:hypothetical protein